VLKTFGKLHPGFPYIAECHIGTKTKININHNRLF
jgi:hypothetical protein